MIPATATTRPLNCTLPGLAISATSTASAVAAIPGTGSVLRVVNEGPSVAFIAVGGNTVAASLPVAVTTATLTSTCTAVLAGADVSFSRDPSTEIYISAICRAGGTAALSVYTGEGL